MPKCPFFLCRNGIVHLDPNNSSIVGGCGTQWVSGRGDSASVVKSKTEKCPVCNGSAQISDADFKTFDKQDHAHPHFQMEITVTHHWDKTAFLSRTED
jgi:hypothetical protein